MTVTSYSRHIARTFLHPREHGDSGRTGSGGRAGISAAADGFHAFFVNLSDTMALSEELTLREAPAP